MSIQDTIDDLITKFEGLKERAEKPGALDEPHNITIITINDHIRLLKELRSIGDVSENPELRETELFHMALDRYLTEKGA